MSAVSTLARRIGAVIGGLVLLLPFLARIFRRKPAPPAPEDLEAAYQRYPQTRDTVETPTAKTK